MFLVKVFFPYNFPISGRITRILILRRYMFYGFNDIQSFFGLFNMVLKLLYILWRKEVIFNSSFFLFFFAVTSKIEMLNFTSILSKHESYNTINSYKKHAHTGRMF